MKGSPRGLPYRSRNPHPRSPSFRSGVAALKGTQSPGVWWGPLTSDVCTVPGQGSRVCPRRDDTGVEVRVPRRGQESAGEKVA